MMSNLTERDLDGHLKGVTDWERFALHLPEIKQHDIDIIKRDNRDDTVAQKLALYGKWLKVYPSASWSDVVRALKEAGYNTIANNITTNLLVPPQAPTMPSGQRKTTRQPEVRVSEDIISELNNLHSDFLSLAGEIESEIERESSSLKQFIRHVQQEKAFDIDFQSVQNVEQFLNAIRPHYNFLDYYLIIRLARLLSRTIAKDASEYELRTRTFMRDTKITKLRKKLKRYFDNSRSVADNRVQVTIAVQNAWGIVNMWLVKELVQQLFNLKHPNECQWFEIIPGSTHFVFLVPKRKESILAERSMNKLEFMRLTGVFRLNVGASAVLEGVENIHYTFEIGLAEAKEHGNKEIVKFLIQCNHASKMATLTTYNRKFLGYVDLFDLSKHLTLVARDILDVIRETQQLVSIVEEVRDIRSTNVVREALLEIKHFVVKASDYIDKINNVVYYFQCPINEQSQSDYDECKARLKHGQNSLTASLKIYESLHSGIGNMQMICDRAASKLAEKVESARVASAGRATRRPTAADHLAVGTGVALSLAAGVFTFGVGTIVGLGLTAALANAAGVGSGGVEAILPESCDSSTKHFKDISRNILIFSDHAGALSDLATRMIDSLKNVYDNLEYDDSSLLLGAIISNGSIAHSETTRLLGEVRYTKNMLKQAIESL